MMVHGSGKMDGADRMMVDISGKVMSMEGAVT